MPKNSAYFEPVDPAPDFPKVEKELLAEWYKKGLVKKYLKRNKDSSKYFSFIDGPITANNPMGVHHAWGRTYKDVWQRFKNMQGFRGRFQNGFDCQGLWVEVEVEKELGFKSKKDIEIFGVANFVNKCKERVLKYSSVQTDQSKRLGYFMDWDHSYFTMSDENNYMIWRFLKVCWERDWIYKGHDSVPWCPRCETAISQHEMLTEDYKELTHDSIIMEFPIEAKENEFLLVWTTTPWTIPANIAVAVDEEADYSLVQGSDKPEKKFWVAAPLVEPVFQGKQGKIIKTVKGKELVGLHYLSAFDGLPAVEAARKENPDKFHSVVATDNLLMPISMEEGTGMVHTAVSAGEEDFRLGRKLGLPMIPVIGDNADYLPGFGELSGKNAKKDPRIILDYLRAREELEGRWVFKIFPYTHRYPACWRCKTELVWKVADEWYIAMDKTPNIQKPKTQEKTLREQLIEVTKKINWLPAFGLERELDWLANMHDWLISKKNRYWGLALPIYECPKCGNFEVIGSKSELKDRAVSGWDKFDGNSPHKPWVDEVKVKCSSCGEVISRIKDVGNPWLDAGIVPFSTIAENNRGEPLYLKNREDWQKWFPADFITESFPGQFKNWFYSLIVMGTVLEGTKSFDNVLGFGTLLAENGKPMHKSSGNAIEFNDAADKIGVDVMRWMFVRQDPKDNLLFGYRLADETRRQFYLKLWNVYNFFVTYANLDNWRPGPADEPEGLKSESVLDAWLLSRLNETTKTATEALERYDALKASGAIYELVDDLSLWYVRRSRNRVGPAAGDAKDKSAFYRTTFYVLKTLSLLLAPFTPFISEVMFRNLSKAESVHLAGWPEASDKADAKLIASMELTRQIAERGHAERKNAQVAVKQPLQSVKVTAPAEVPEGKILDLIKDELNVKAVEWEKGTELTAVLDTKITPELEEEAKARDLIRKIQEERRSMGMNLTQMVSVMAPWVPSDKKLIQWVLTKTSTKELKIGEFKVEKA